MSVNAALPENVSVTYSWECPTCHLWEHGFEDPQYAAQTLYEHEDESHG